MKLSTPVLVDAVLIMGTNIDTSHLSEFYIFVGWNSEHCLNTECPGAPFAYPTDGNYGTYVDGYSDRGSDWSNGAEVWCGLTGDYVSFVRPQNA